MFTITFVNKHFRRWNSEYVFKSIEGAKEFLRLQGYIEDGRVFVRENKGWSGKRKAYINKVKVCE